MGLSMILGLDGPLGRRAVKARDVRNVSDDVLSEAAVDHHP
jgi:hypothetical protein